jgi:hypothetical protein
MRKKTNKKWKTPLLTVVVRGKPEESVLAACKGPYTNTGFNMDGGMCAFHYVGPCHACAYDPGS